MPCQFPGCRFTTNNDWCIHHKMYSGFTPEPKTKQPLPKKSDKRKVDEKEYKKIVKSMLAESDSCELKVEGLCTKKATGLHHMAKRTGSNYLNKKYLKRSCDACNNWVEKNPLDAIVKGISISKYKTD